MPTFEQCDENFFFFFFYCALELEHVDVQVLFLFYSYNFKIAVISRIDISDDQRFESFIGLNLSHLSTIECRNEPYVTKPIIV